MICLAKQIFKTINCTVLFHTSVSKCKLSSNTVKINNNIPSTFNIIAKIIQYKNITNEIDSSTKMILDTGTTKHMSCLLDLSTSLTKVMDCYTTLGDGTTKLPVMGKGTIKIYIESHVVEKDILFSITEHIQTSNCSLKEEKNKDTLYYPIFSINANWTMKSMLSLIHVLTLKLHHISRQMNPS